MTVEHVTDYVYVIRLPETMRAQLQHQVEMEDRPLSRIIRQAIREYLLRWPEGKP